MGRFPDSPEYTGLNTPLGEEYEIPDLAIEGRIPAEVEGRREEHESVHGPRGVLRTGVDRDERAQARSDERDGSWPCGFDRRSDLVEHPRHGQRFKGRQVEVRAGPSDAMASELGREPARFRGRGRGGKAVEVDDVADGGQVRRRVPGWERHAPFSPKEC